MTKKKTAPTSGITEISAEWQKWIFENIIEGYELERLVAIMVEKGFELEVAKSAVVGIATKLTPYPISAASAKHKPIKVYDGPEGLVYDNFLPEEDYEKLYKFALTTRYKYINTTTTASAWHINDGFPLRSELDAFYGSKQKNDLDEKWIYPTGTEFDILLQHLVKFNQEIKHLVGEPEKDWKRLSATSWLYPKGTSLSLHDDGAGVYSGAYTYYLNPEWQLNWGGMLLIMDPESNKLVKEYKERVGEVGFHRKQWLDESELDSIMWKNGMAKCIMPKRNRVVFIANDAYHMITKVSPDAGDRVRMAIAGFFHIKEV